MATFKRPPLLAQSSLPRRSSNAGKLQASSSSFSFVNLLVPSRFAKAAALVAAKHLVGSTSGGGVVLSSAIVAGSMLSAALFSVVAHRPWSATIRGVSSAQWTRIASVSAAEVFALLFLLASATHLSLIRVISYTEQCSMWLPAVVALMTGRDGGLKSTGVRLIALSIVLSLLSDAIFKAYDIFMLRSASDATSSVHHAPSTFAGLVLLVLSALLSTLAQKWSKQLAQEVEGSRRLFALSTPVSAAIALLVYFCQWAVTSEPTQGLFTTSLAPSVLLMGMALVVGNFYGTQAGLMSGGGVPATVKQSWLASVASLSVVCFVVYRVVPVTAIDIAALACIYAGISSVLSTDAFGLGGGHGQLPTSSSAKFRGSSAVDYMSSETPWSVLLKVYLKSIVESKDSRSIFYFLCLNLAYMFVQLVYGVWTNSLGLISDAIHMLFDCMALAVGLFAAVMAKWSANKQFSFGYSRIETLSGFANGIFLVFISLFILIEGIERIVHPPEMNTDRLLLVAVVGFIVNMIGIFSFHHGHGHGHGHDHGHDHGHGDGHHHHHHDNANMHGVFLHIMADALGSFGVIVSTLLIYQFGWTGFDPLASLLIAILIFISTLPLIQHSFRILMLKMPGACYAHADETVHAIKHIAGVSDVPSMRCWTYDGVQPLVMLTVVLAPRPDVAVVEQTVLNDVTRVCEQHLGVKPNHLTVEFVWAEEEQVVHSQAAGAANGLGMVTNGHHHQQSVEEPERGRKQDHHGHGHDHRQHSAGVGPVAAVLNGDAATQRRSHSALDSHHHHQHHHHHHGHSQDGGAQHQPPKGPSDASLI